jgi:hypothetical protein
MHTLSSALIPRKSLKFGIHLDDLLLLTGAADEAVYSEKELQELALKAQAGEELVTSGVRSLLFLCLPFFLKRPRAFLALLFLPFGFECFCKMLGLANEVRAKPRAHSCALFPHRSCLVFKLPLCTLTLAGGWWAFHLMSHIIQVCLSVLLRSQASAKQNEEF